MKQYVGRKLYRISNPLSLLPRPWMRLIIHLGEVLEIKMGINLGGGDIGVAEEFLYGA